MHEFYVVCAFGRPIENHTKSKTVHYLIEILMLSLHNEQHLVWNCNVQSASKSHLLSLEVSMSRSRYTMLFLWIYMEGTDAIYSQLMFALWRWAFLFIYLFIYLSLLMSCFLIHGSVIVDEMITATGTPVQNAATFGNSYKVVDSEEMVRTYILWKHQASREQRPKGIYADSVHAVYHLRSGSTPFCWQKLVPSLLTLYQTMLLE